MARNTPPLPVDPTTGLPTAPSPGGTGTGAVPGGDMAGGPGGVEISPPPPPPAPDSTSDRPDFQSGNF